MQILLGSNFYEEGQSLDEKKMYEYRKHQSQQKSERDNKKQENKKYLQICTWKKKKKL